METIKGNILDIFREADEAYLLHGVSCQPVLHAGLAKQIIAEYPDLLRQHRLVLQTHKPILGSCFFYTVSFAQKSIVNLYQQLTVGRGSQQIDYDAFKSSLIHFKLGRLRDDIPVYIPEGIGSGNAGGRKELILTIIEEILPEAILVQYNGS